MRLAATAELNAVRGSNGSGSVMAAGALKVKREGFLFFSLVPHPPLKQERRQSGRIS